MRSPAADTDQSIHLEDVVPGEWDRVLIVGPLTTSEQVNEMAGTQLPAQLAGQVEHSSDDQMLVFLHGDEVVTWTAYLPAATTGADVSNVSGESHTRTDAEFDVSIDQHGTVYLVPSDR